MRVPPALTLMACGLLLPANRRRGTFRGRPQKIERPHPTSRVTPSTSCRRGTSPCTEISLGARAHRLHHGEVVAVH